MTAPMVIVGAGQAGLQVAESLRAEGHDGAIVLIGEEAAAPYHRPPLSKGVLSGDMSAEQIEIRGPQALARKGIDLRAGTRVVAIDRTARQVRLADGDVLGYAGLALATGARLRPLPVPGAGLAGLFGLRTLADTRALMAALPASRRAVIVGGGFIGLEAAAVLAKQGKEITVVEAAGRLMGRAVHPLVSAHFLELHRSHGVQVELDALVAEIQGEDGRATGVRLADGRSFPADLVLVGVGVLANDQLAAAAGLECEGGIVVDACGRTSDPQVAAAGDCTARRGADGGLIRLESVQNAVEQGKAAAAALMGKERPFRAAPWFWSDQYDVKLQMVGTSQGGDRVVRRGTEGAGAFSLFHFHDGRLIGVDSLNRPDDHMAGRRILDRPLPLSPEQAADPAFALHDLR